MTDAVNPGDYVFAIADVSCWRVRGHKRDFVQKGEELLVTSVSKSRDWLNVKTSKYAPVMRIEASSVTAEGRRMGEMPADGILPDDPRVAWIFEDAARLADRMGYCNIFDEITEKLSLPGRVRTFTLTYEVAAGVKLQAKIEARSRHQAEGLLRERMTSARPLKELTA